jgi:cytochrome c oxidase subunit II
MKLSRAFAGALIGLACVCVGAVFLVRFHTHGAPGSTLSIKAVAHQWWWEFDYPSLGIKSSDVLYVPTGTNVRLELASADVIHSFWIVGMKESVDILPGQTHPLDLVVASPGELYGNCDSGCGCGTVCMRFRVLASSPGNFDQWAAHAHLLSSEFKPPHPSEAPACALNGWHRSHTEYDSLASHLRRLLDGG